MERGAGFEKWEGTLHAPALVARSVAQAPDTASVDAAGRAARVETLADVPTSALEFAARTPPPPKLNLEVEMKEEAPGTEVPGENTREEFEVLGRAEGETRFECE